MAQIKPKQLTAHRGDDFLFGLALGQELGIAGVQAMLGFPGNRLDVLALLALARRQQRRPSPGRCRYAQAASITIRRRCALPALLIDPRRIRSPLECSRETAPL